MKRTLLVMLVVSLSSLVLADTTGLTRYDQSIESRASQQLAAKKEFQGVQSTVQDGIVTLTGEVGLYQQKLDAAKKVRKVANVQGVRNLIEVAGPNVPDGELTAQLDRKLYYDRMGLDIAFNYVTASVESGVVTLNGETLLDVDRQSALWLAYNTPGVKDVINNISVAPVSNFDDRIRFQAVRMIYRDPVLSRYAIDPAPPIRIVVNNGKLALYGTVANQMDKNVAGIRASQVFGAFSVQNNLQVAKKS